MLHCSYIYIFLGRVSSAEKSLTHPQFTFKKRKWRILFLITVLSVIIQLNVPPNAKVADLKYMIKEKIPFDDFDLYVNDTGRDIKKDFNCIRIM